MPSKNSIKCYSENSYYHIYNRGVEKRSIFQDEQDYGVFLGYLKEYLLFKNEFDLRNKLSSPEVSYQEKDKIIKLLRLNNFFEEIILLAFALMSNHFHLLIKQKSAQMIDKFMQSLCTRYTMYFNKKYKRVGSLFQAVYKAVLVESDEQLLHLSRYIHLQTLASQGETLQIIQPSSCPEYMGIRKTDWVHPEEILSYFSKTNPSLAYETFIIQKDDYDFVAKLRLEE